MSSTGNNPFSGRMLAIGGSCFILSWLLMGLPTTILFRKMVGTSGPFDTGVIPDPAMFFRVSEIAACAALIVCSGWAWTLWRFARARASRRRNTAVVLASAISGQVVFGAISAFYPQVSSLQVITDRFPSRTAYSEGFVRDSFLLVRPGMARSAVEGLVGRGFTEWTAPIPYNAAMWVYSRPLNGENYWMFQVFFSEDGTVRKTAVQYWCD